MEKAKADAILNHLCQTIGGEWLLVGGTLVQLHYDGERATEDLDLVHISHAEKSREIVQNELFQFTLKKWGLGPEFINLSAEFFVAQFPGWELERVLLTEGSKGRVWRPTITLFCALKLNRASELDLSDIRIALQKESAALNIEKLRNWVTPEKFQLFLRIFSKNSNTAVPTSGDR